MSDDYAYKMDIQRAIFAKQLDYICNQCVVLPADRIRDPNAQGVFLSFDDGLRNLFEWAAPALEERGLTAMFAICPGHVDGDFPHLWGDHLYLLLRNHLGKMMRFPQDGYCRPQPVTASSFRDLAAETNSYLVENNHPEVYEVLEQMCDMNSTPYTSMAPHSSRFCPLEWGMVRELRSRGHEIASHTWSHRMLARLPADVVRTDLMRSKKRLELGLDEQVDLLVYPYGGVDEVGASAVSLAEELGYERAFFNVIEVPANLPPHLAVPRFGVGRSARPASMQPKLSGLEARTRRLLRFALRRS